MKGIILLLLLMISAVHAEQLEIKIDEHTLSLPYWSAKRAHYGAILMVKGGGQPEGSELLASFAKKLAQNGWSVVLLNCNQNTELSWVEQLPEVIRMFRADNQRIVLIHYGDQLSLSLNYFSKPQSKMINGLVMLSAYDTQNTELLTQNVRFPIFDIVGQFDYDDVLMQTELRGKEFSRQKYLAVEMPGADHDYEYNQNLLLAFMHGWMTKLPAFKPQPPPILLSYIEPVYFAQSSLSSISRYFTLSLS